MSIPAIMELFRSGRVLPPGEATEDQIFAALMTEARNAMLAAGSPPDHPLDPRIGRIVSRYIRRFAMDEDTLAEMEHELRALAPLTPKQNLEALP